MDRIENIAKLVEKYGEDNNINVLELGARKQYELIEKIKKENNFDQKSVIDNDYILDQVWWDLTNGYDQKIMAKILA